MDQVLLKEIFAKDMSGVTAKSLKVPRRHKTMCRKLEEFENTKSTHALGTRIFFEGF
jgi:hypothetical protein